MQATPATIALSFAMLAGLAACGWCWFLAALRAAATWGWIIAPPPAGLPQLPLIPWTPRKPVPWALIDLLLLIGIWLAVKLPLETAAVQFGWLPRAADLSKLTLPQQQAFGLLAIAESLAILAIGLPLIALRTGAGPRDFGWSARDFLSDLKTGLLGFVMLAPPVYILQALLVYFWQPSEHPFIEMFKKSPDRGFFAVLFAAAAIVAPLYEELMFRVLLQGFLERAVSHTGPLRELLFDLPRPALPVARQVAIDGSPLEPNQTAEQAAAELNPYEVSQVVDDEPPVAPPVVPKQPELRGASAWCAIGISSVVFALLHLSHGPDWVPLMPLAAGMGYLYQRTHRLVPSLVVHSGLNGFTMWILWVSIFEQAK